ncbi:hypothetical protein TEA_025840 [Camellia sinensis var. sinensis]|uniref:Increased DNA methylation 1 C-terminal domain-containing protein n=1 Tax=Camellia sinensis var. sinensis TaxID=542762 RepID=A0A4S4EAD3_CAMSN|nr:hypothetical protein TEA_025840 [Camellia sinensis var. sinensis]
MSTVHPPHFVSRAVKRIHGTKLAEMPFITTRESYRSQGMCRRLMVAIESALCYLKVESMVIPSIREKIGTWIERYGFQHIGPSLSKEIRLRNTLTFHDSYRLQKILAVPQAREVHEAENNKHQNGPNLLCIAAREVHEAENNEHQNGPIF